MKTNRTQKSSFSRDLVLLTLLLLSPLAHGAAPTGTAINFNQLISDGGMEQRSKEKDVLAHILAVAKTQNAGESKEIVEFLETQVEFKKNTEYVQNRNPDSIPR